MWHFQKTQDLSEAYVDAFKKGDYQTALKAALKALKKDSENIHFLTNAGNAFYMLHNYDEALKLYQKVRMLSPDYIWGKINLANVLCEQKKYQQTIDLCLEVLEEVPHNISVLSLLSNSYYELERYLDSIEVDSRILELDSSAYWSFSAMGMAYQKLGEYDQAVEYAYMAVDESNGADSQQVNLGYTLYEVGLEIGFEKVADVVDKWAKEYGQNPLVDYWTKALRNDAAVSVANPKYVRKIFDYFADSFDDSLQNLDYQVPDIIADFVAGFYGKKWFKNLTILDLGCGTGICGTFLKNYARWRGLDGVDLSKRMLQKARERQAYGYLYCDEILHYLNRTQKCYNLMVAADVFTYFGKLDSLFKKMNLRLAKKGRIIFSITQNNVNDQDYFLHSSGRFIHSDSYLKNILKKTGFEIEKVELKKLREEGDSPVMGWVVAAQKI